MIKMGVLRRRVQDIITAVLLVLHDFSKLNIKGFGYGFFFYLFVPSLVY